MNDQKSLTAPFPYFGGKHKTAEIVWNAFGDVEYYSEPFFGSGANLLARPTSPKFEVVNDKDYFVANFWRSIIYAPDVVAEYIDWPISEVDLHTRHDWLVTEGIEALKPIAEDAMYFHAPIAGWWAWGLSSWLGREWCAKAYQSNKRTWRQKPNLTGSGIHRKGIADVYDYMERLHNRLRNVRVMCGDWSRVVTPACLGSRGYAGIFLDPPYNAQADRDNNLYAREDDSVSNQVRAWAIENGTNPRYRIALCGYDGEHELPDTWTKYCWSTGGGYSNIARSSRAKENRHREVIWFSPYCLDYGEL